MKRAERSRRAKPKAPGQKSRAGCCAQRRTIRKSNRQPRAGDRNRFILPVSILTSVTLPIASLALVSRIRRAGMPAQPLSERIAQATDADKPNDLVAKVEERLREHPEDGPAGMSIAPVYYAMGRYDDAAGAYAECAATGWRKPAAAARFRERAHPDRERHRAGRCAQSSGAHSRHCPEFRKSRASGWRSPRSRTAASPKPPPIIESSSPKRRPMRRGAKLSKSGSRASRRTQAVLPQPATEAAGDTPTPAVSSPPVANSDAAAVMCDEPGRTPGVHHAYGRWPRRAP